MMKQKTEWMAIVPVVLKALALAMAVAVLVLSWLGGLETETAVFFLALGLFALALVALWQPTSLPASETAVAPTAVAPSPPPTLPPLSEREQEIMQLLAQGLSNREIADRLFLAEGTVKNYLTTLMQKLDVLNRDDAVRRARELGLLQN